MHLNDRLAAAMLAILIAIVAIIVVFAANDPAAFEKPETHPQFESMQVGGPAADRDEDYWWVGWLVGSLMFAFTGGMLMFAVNQIEDSRGIRIISVLIMILLLIAFAYGSFSYRDFGQAGQPLVKSIAPQATKALLFGVWVVPMLYTVVWVFGFDRWFMTAASNSNREQ